MQQPCVHEKSAPCLSNFLYFLKKLRIFFGFLVYKPLLFSCSMGYLVLMVAHLNCEFNKIIEALISRNFVPIHIMFHNYSHF